MITTILLPVSFIVIGAGVCLYVVMSFIKAVRLKYRVGDYYIVDGFKMQLIGVDLEGDPVVRLGSTNIYGYLWRNLSKM